MLLLDGGTKAWVAEHVERGVRTALIDGFLYLTHVHNPGAAFGLFADAAASVRIAAFTAVTAVAIGVIASFYVRLAPGERWTAAALGLVTGGALGNLINRFVVEDGVIDFLHVTLFSGFAWPDFNVADMAIVLGVAALMLDVMAAEGRARARGVSLDDD
ncbi:MAG: signal peptidase II [Proteobacteria bacterium]|nr:signal peptidase II [Pseudomonadota bacterium]